MRFLLICIACWFAPVVAVAAEQVDFQSDVFPILQKYCVGCHTEDDTGGDLNLDNHAAMMSGGENGLAITAGVPDSSRLFLMASGKMEPVMPPDGEPGPTQDELDVLSAWIEQGAKGPSGDAPVRMKLRTPEIPVREGVSTPITAMAASASGKVTAFARFRSVELVDRNGAVLKTIGDQPGKVNSLEFSKDGKRLLVASGVTGAYGRAVVVNVENGEQVQEFVGHRDTLYSAVFSPDGTRVATAGYDRDIILWDVDSGEAVRNFAGHNGAIFDLAFSPDGSLLASACADETVKIWNVAEGLRLDTLNQPEGEVFAVEITADGKHVIAASSDNRLRVWKLISTDKPRINPIVATRFVDESALVDFAMTQSGDAVVVLSQSGNLKVLSASDWNQYATLDPLGETGTDLVVLDKDHSVAVSMMNGKVARRDLPARTSDTGSHVRIAEPVYLDLDELASVNEDDLRKASGGTGSVDVPRGVTVRGVIGVPGEADKFNWTARAGEMWAIDVDAVDKSSIDPIVVILDSQGAPVLKTRLQAVRDSYFTFRGKDSKQVNDFRVFNWQEMNLSEYLYSAGEVTRLWLHPRGPDSGFNVYPGEGQRWTYFGTTPTTHALGEPAYIVRELSDGESPTANGLPVFDIFYENDDDPMRLAGKNSRLLFKAPNDGTFTVCVSDTTGAGSESMAYKLAIRPAAPAFKAKIQAANGTLRKGAGREFVVRVDRVDGFDGPVTFELPDLPSGLRSNAPVTIEAGQRFAVGMIWADENAVEWEGKVKPEIVAHATVAGRRVERKVGVAGEFTLGDRPSVIPSMQPIDHDVAENEEWTLQVRRGETVSARVVLRRKEGFNNEVSFGKEDSGRNTSQGVYVDNIGLNGLLIRANQNEREFFLTADPTTLPGKRRMHLKANVDGGVTTHPITVEVLP